MTEEVNFDESLLSALEKAEERIIKEFFAHYDANKYKNKFKISLGKGKFLRMVIIMKKAEELPYQYASAYLLYEESQSDLLRLALPIL